MGTVTENPIVAFRSSSRHGPCKSHHGMLIFERREFWRIKGGAMKLPFLSTEEA